MGHVQEGEGGGVGADEKELSERPVLGRTVPAEVPRAASAGGKPRRPRANDGDENHPGVQ